MSFDDITELDLCKCGHPWQDHLDCDKYHPCTECQCTQFKPKKEGEKEGEKP